MPMPSKSNGGFPNKMKPSHGDCERKLLRLVSTLSPGMPPRQTSNLNDFPKSFPCFDDTNYHVISSK